LERPRWDRSAEGMRTSSQVEPQFVGERLRLARNYHGMTLVELGERIAADPAFLSRIENGKQQPSATLLAALSEELGFEEEFFFAKLTDPFALTECHFRHLRKTPKRLKESVLAQGSLVAEFVCRLADELTLPDFNVPELRAESDAEIEETTRRCRAHWNLGENSPISNMVRLAENAGVVVVRLPENSRDVDAFSRFGHVSVIVLNDDKQSATRSRFDVGHELGHLVMHRGRETGDPITEGQANRFASALLLPRDGFSKSFRQMAGLNWSYLFELKRLWKVSVAAIVRRAFDLGLLRTAEYRRAYKYLHARGWHRGEPYEPAIEEPELLRLAMNAYQQETGRSPRDLAHLLRWRGAVMEHISGQALPPPPPPGNVTVLQSYRNRR
jgi:Zn-dependent peptidase ImmA (M78 family)/DNA-binding XRE family transcriptional regulator